jgi:uncharacterized YigZ family protein
MKGISGHCSAETSVRNSRFLAEAFCVSGQEAARALLREQKERYRDATHVVHAFVIGSTGGILGCSDDGEPSGTAGRPVLDVLRGAGLTNAMVTVTRWFGGTLLGTGGLVKAYGEAAKAVLAIAPAHELVARVEFTLVQPYDCHERLRREIDSRGGELVSASFGESVTAVVRIEESRWPELRERINEVSSGRATVTLSEESPKGRKA